MRSTHRLLAAAGLLYPILLILAFAGFPQPPGGDLSPADNPTWLGAHTGPVIAQAYLRSGAALGFLLLTVALATLARPAAARIIVAGGAGFSTLLLIGQAVVLAAAFGARQAAPPAVIRGAGMLSQALLDLSSLPAVLVFAAGALTLFGTSSIPVWLSWLTAVGVPLALVDALSYDGGPLAFFGGIGLAYFLIWSTVCAVTLTRVRSEHQAAAADTIGLHSGHDVRATASATD